MDKPECIGYWKLLNFLRILRQKCRLERHLENDKMYQVKEVTKVLSILLV